MKDQLILLLELQRIDSRVREVRASIAALPEKLQPAKRDLAKLEAMLNVEKHKLAETEVWRREQEDLIETDEDGLKKAKLKVQAAKTPRDFAAASREVDNKRRSISEREDEVLKVIEAIEKATTEIATHETDVETLRGHIGDQEAEVLKTVTTLEAEATEHASGRDEIAAKVDERTLARYEDTLRKKGYALAPIEDGTCQGCHMAVPPQLNNVIARNQSIEMCPRCKRLVYRKDFLELDGQ